MKHNYMTPPALKRLYGDLKILICADSYEIVGSKYKRAKLGALSARWIVSQTPTTTAWHNIKLSQAVLRNSIRHGVADATYRSHTEEFLLIMHEDWCKWTPSRITLDEEDLAELTKLALKGPRDHSWEPDWRLYGAGLINVSVVNGEKVGEHSFTVSLSDAGRARLEQEIGKSVDDLREFQAEAQREEEARLKRRHIHWHRTAGLRDMVFIDFECDELIGFVATYLDSTKRFSFSGSISSGHLGTHLESSLLGKFLIGIDRMTEAAVNNTPCYYDMNTSQIVWED